MSEAAPESIPEHSQVEISVEPAEPVAWTTERELRRMKDRHDDGTTFKLNVLPSRFSVFQQALYIHLPASDERLREALEKIVSRITDLDGQLGNSKVGYYRANQAFDDILEIARAAFAQASPIQEPSE